jgi:excinuclease UvrABC ATPase subunit
MIGAQIGRKRVVSRYALPIQHHRRGVAVSQEYIEIRGARENNLKNVSLRIPKRKITIFTGVSGSGKSSIVFDTVASEARRQLNETFSTFVRNFLPRYAQPDVDAIENLSMAIVVDQKRLGGGSHSTVGTITDIYSLLRLLFSRFGKPYVGNRLMFSFNDPQGRCPECNGVGRKLGVDLDRFLDTSKSLKQGAILYPDYAVDSWGWNLLMESGLFDANKPLKKYSDEEMERLLYSPPYKVKMKVGGKSINLTFDGIVAKFTEKYITRDLKTYSERTQKTAQPFMTVGPCKLCKGARLSQAALGSKIHGHNIAQMAAMEVDKLIDVIRAIKEPAAAPIAQTLVERLQHMIDIGLEYLSLSRETDTLSGGESQRIKMVKHLSSSLVDVMYVFDEPSIGMHPRDVHRLNELLQKLRDKGNTVLVVEHDPDVIKVADHVVDVGPHAGHRGGTVVYAGTYEGLLKTDTLTGKHIKQAMPIKPTFRADKGRLRISHAKANNLQDVSVDIPKGVLTVVTGVAGSGKSSLIHQTFLAQHPDAVVIDQSAVGVSSRSNPATYTGIMDDVRKAFASANKVSPSLFSFNSEGACENCKGLGVIYTELAFLDEVKTPCEVCGGKRFKDEVLGYKLNGKSISDVLAMPAHEALELFDNKEIRKKLQALSDVGLDYLTLGQPLSTLSGGECQRIKLASELHKKGSVYVMDEPTTGLHMSDIGHLLAIMNRLVEGGNTVVVIEHNLDVIRNADWIIDMGPEGGSKGGKVMFEGTPKQLLTAKQSLTSAYLDGGARV